MRKYLYINDELVKSFIAQINKGWINESKQTKGSISEGRNENKLGYALNGQFATNIFLAKTKFDGTFTNEKINDFMESNSENVTNEIVLHDYAIDVIIDYFRKHNEITNNVINFNIGDIVRLNNKMTPIDIPYLKTVIEKTDIIKLLGKPSDSTAEVLNKLDSNIKNGDAYISLVNIFDYALPFKKCLIIDDCLISCEDQYYRDNPEVVAFKYGGKPVVLGYITNIIYNKPNDDNNAFSSLINMVNQVMFNFVNKNKLFIVNPIAIFYE